MDIKALKRGEQALVAGCVLFAGTGDGLINRALSDGRCRLVETDKGAVVFDAYDYRNCLGLVLSGRIAVTKPAGSRYVMNTLARGALFGAASLYDDDGEAVSVLTALVPCRIAFFPRGLIEELMAEENAVAMNYIRFLTSCVRFLNEKIQDLVSENAAAALGRYLAANAQTDGGKLTVHLDGSMTRLAEALNIGRASLYRAFTALERAHIIRKNGKEIEILNPSGLSKME